MRVIKKIDVPAKTETVHDYTQCDLCGAVTNQCNPEEWAKGDFAVDRVLVQRTHGYGYPGDYSTTVISCDICPECFEKKLKPWLESQGVKFVEREVYG